MPKEIMNPLDLKPYKQYGLISHNTSELVPPMSGRFLSIDQITPIISDRPSNIQGFNVNPKYYKFSDNAKNVNVNHLVTGKKYKVVAKNPIVRPMNAVFLGYNYKLKFDNKEILPGVFIPDTFIIDRRKTTIYELSDDARHDLFKVSSSPSPSNSSPNANKLNMFKVSTNKTRRGSRAQHRTKSSRSRKYI